MSCTKKYPINTTLDTTAPIITLAGANPQTIELGDGYTELGASTDDSSTVTIDDSEFVDAVGTYTIYYDANDGFNDAVQLTRTVYVVDLASHFVTTWKTDNPGTSGVTSITIPTRGTGYNYDVDWDNDGLFDEFGITGNITHDFAVAGIYTIRVQGDFPTIYFNNVDDKEKILLIEQWGDIQWESMERAFYGCSNFDVVAIDAPNLSNATNLQNMFLDCLVLKGNSTFNNWNTGSIQNFNGMFFGASLFNEAIGDWDMSMAIQLFGMFSNASAFNQDISGWIVSNVTNMSVLFANATSFNQDIGSWDVSNVTNMSSMFNGASLSTANYDALLQGWSSQTLQSNIIFDGGNSTYCLSEIERQNVINNFGWQITDGGINCAVDPATAFVTTWGVGSNDIITIPTRTDLVYNYTVDWGDGTVENFIGLHFVTYLHCRYLNH